MPQSSLGSYTLNLNQAIQWGDMDAFNHINNTVYFRYFENARIHYFDLAGINDYMSAHKIGPILGYTDCKFLAPLTYPDRITIATRISQIKEKRFTMDYLVFSEKLNRDAACGSGEIIYFDYQKMSSCSIPPEILNKINQLEGPTLNR